MYISGVLVMLLEEVHNVDQRGIGTNNKPNYSQDNNGHVLDEPDQPPAPPPLWPAGQDLQEGRKDEH